MGQGIDLAREDSPGHAQIVEDLKEQLLIVLLKRLKGTQIIHISEMDDTANDLMLMSADAELLTFKFELAKKQ